MHYPPICCLYVISILAPDITWSNHVSSLQRLLFCYVLKGKTHFTFQIISEEDCKYIRRNENCINSLESIMFRILLHLFGVSAFCIVSSYGSLWFAQHIPSKGVPSQSSKYLKYKMCGPYKGSVFQRSKE